MDSSPTYLDPKTLSEFKDLRLRASTIVDGLVTGMHRSPFQGNSVEFSQHREYVPGDDMRYVDWKVFARTDNVHVKQYEDETNLCCWLVVDQSPSMHFKSANAVFSKYDYACCFGVTLAWLVLNQRDAMALVTFADVVKKIVRPSDQKENLTNMIETLSGESQHGQTKSSVVKTDFRSSLAEVAVEARKRGVVVVVSDCFDDFESLAAGMETLCHRKHQVILLQTLDRAELEFDISQPVQMKGMESDLSVMIDPIALRKAYQKVVENSTNMITRFCQKQNIQFQQITTDMNIASVLRKILR